MHESARICPVDIKSAILYFVCQEYGQLICRHFHFCVNLKFILRDLYIFFEAIPPMLFTYAMAVVLFDLIWMSIPSPISLVSPNC